MKRRDLEKHLRKHGCEPDVNRSGRGAHDVWRNPEKQRKAAIPRHREVKTMLGRQVCRDLGVPVIESK
jgi:predicted RNA binding protein YcfA (HicA-like mRNA interferase family)